MASFLARYDGDSLEEMLNGRMDPLFAEEAEEEREGMIPNHAAAPVSNPLRTLEDPDNCLESLQAFTKVLTGSLS